MRRRDQELCPSDAPLDSRDGTLWCKKCGCYATRWPRRLRLPCSSKPVSEAQSNVRRRLAENKPPTIAAYLLAEAGITERVDAIGNASIVAGSRRPPSAPPCHRYLRLLGGPLHSAARASSVSCGAHESDSARSHNAVSVNVGPLATSAVRMGEPRVGLSENLGSADGIGASQNQVRLEGADLARPVRRRIANKSKIDVSQGGVLQKEDGGSDAERRFDKQARAASWIGRVAVGATRHSTQCSVCGAMARTRCRGCYNALRMQCMRSNIRCTISSER